MLYVSIVLLILALLVYLYCGKSGTSVNVSIENFTNEERYTSEFRPIYEIPFNELNKPQRLINPDMKIAPGYQEDDYLYYPRNRYSLINETNTKYCKRNPACYPCPGWTQIGNPYCPPH